VKEFLPADFPGCLNFQEKAMHDRRRFGDNKSAFTLLTRLLVSSPIFSSPSSNRLIIHTHNLTLNIEGSI
jgi:hypothetical protein